MKHKIIQTENYLIVVDDSEIKEGDYYLFTWGGEQDIQRFQNQQDDRIKHQHLYETACKKIIAHLPLNNSPILEGVDLLPPLEDDEVDKLAIEKYPVNMGEQWTEEGLAYPLDFNYGFRQGFLDGYNKTKEKYKYTEEDLRKAMKYASEITNNKMKYMEDYIQSLQQPKYPIGFECEMEDAFISNGEKYLDESGISQYYTHHKKPKTTINSQGQTQWVGKYIY
jgi:hypothetical protein